MKIRNQNDKDNKRNSNIVYRCFDNISNVAHKNIYTFLKLIDFMANQVAKYKLYLLNI